MGLSAHCLKLLEYAAYRGCDFDRVVTLGRQEVHLTSREIAGFFRAIRSEEKVRRVGACQEFYGMYCEGLLSNVYGSALVDSVDASLHEGATLLRDLNEPLPQADHGKYSLVVDFGTTEHVFDVASAMRNVRDLCAVGGTILHVLPANNHCGHGFYQFSPELFYSLYSSRRGFDRTEVFVSELGRSDIWWLVAEPAAHRARVNITNSQQLFVLALTRKVANLSESVVSPNQSDYESVWRREKVDIYGRSGSRLVGQIKASVRAFIRTHPNSRKHVYELFVRFYRLAKPDSLRWPSRDRIKLNVKHLLKNRPVPPG